MISPLFQKLLVQPRDVTPSQDDLEVIGTFNPGAVEYGGEVMFLMRVAERPRERRVGFTALPRWHEGRVVIDWVADEDLETRDARVVRIRSNGLLRLTFTSHLHVMQSRNGRVMERWNIGCFMPQHFWEEYGVEDPRIVKFDDRYWITYVAVSRHGACTALASTSDFISFERHGIIFCPENKDVILFPERLEGEYLALHRPTTAHPFCRPEIWLAKSPDLIQWGKHEPLYGGKAAWETDRVGGGAPPLKTNAGWLEIYHASRQSKIAGCVGAYVAAALLLDLNNPSRVIGRIPFPLWEPNVPYEMSGFLPQVVFPTGSVLRGDTLQIFYGAADTNAAVIELSLSAIIAACTE